MPSSRDAWVSALRGSSRTSRFLASHSFPVAPSGAGIRLLPFVYLLISLLAVPCWAGCDSASGGDEGEDLGLPSRLPRLTQGINTSHWFAQTDLTPLRFNSFIRPGDAALIKEMGFRHIRLSLDPDVLLVPEQPDSLQAENLAIFDRKLDMVLREGLAVIVDLHPSSDFKHTLARSPIFVEQVKAFWGALAAHLSSRDPRYLFLEVMNEPEFEDADAWNDVQAQLLAVMRANAPEHTLIATGPRWSGISELLQVVPVDDDNVVYNFHLYDPFHFTHQGATWGWDATRHFRDLPYPSSPEGVAPLLPALDPSVRGYVEHYGRERWNRDRLEERVKQAADWAQAHGVHLTCNEFGTYRLVAPPADREAWLADVRSVLEQYGIGWAMWDYAGGFSIVNVGANGAREPDEAALRALGLRD